MAPRVESRLRTDPIRSPRGELGVTWSSVRKADPSCQAVHRAAYGICSLVICFLSIACVTASDQDTNGGDGDSPLIVSTLDLFSQAEPPKSGKTWQGDWEFRRDRLEVVDSGLRDIRPDVSVFQNALARAGSSAESDKIILSAGALGRYEWHDVVIESVKETGESRSLAVAVAKPFAVDPQPDDGERGNWQMGADGHLVFFNLRGASEPILVADVLMPSKRDQVGLWYSFVQERIMERIKQRRACLNRLIIAGYLPADQDSRRAREFMTKLGLRDSATGFCQNASRCQTASTTNEMFNLSRKDEETGQVDRILVHESTRVLSAGLAFTRNIDSSQYKDLYGLNHIFASNRYGWTARIRLAPCAE